MKKNFTAEETYLSVFCNNKNVYTQYIKIDSQRLHLASDIKQFLEHWKELEVVSLYIRIEYSFAGVRSKALWFPYPLSPNNVTYASYSFIAIPFFETFFFIQNGIPLLGYSVIMPIHHFSIPFFSYIIQGIVSRSLLASQIERLYSA